MNLKRKFDRAYTVTVFDKEHGNVIWTQAFKQEATAWARMDEWAAESDHVESRGKIGWTIVLTTTEAPFIP